MEDCCKYHSNTCRVTTVYRLTLDNCIGFGVYNKTFLDRSSPLKL